MDHIEQKICEIIDQNQEEIKAFGRDIWHHAEMGYKEYRTAEKFVEYAKKYGLETETGLAVTGVKSYLKGKGKEGITVGVIGEMDALPIANHPDANPETGASHCCGHNAQLTGVIGAMMALTDPEVKEAMDGNVVFMAAPAEEYVDLPFKQQLIREGKIRYGGGKCELIRVGALDDIDIAVGHHTAPELDLRLSNGSTNGFVNKIITYTGVASHAAAAPHMGIDAQNAAMLALHALDLQRESFQEKDFVRVHSMITKGAPSVNVIADTVELNNCVRAKSVAAVKDASRKADRSFRAGAVATGCGMRLETVSGYMPTIPCSDVTALKEALEEVAGDQYKIEYQGAEEHTSASTDFGDVSCIMPLLQFSTGGYTGQLHNPDVRVTDEYLAYVVTAKIFALTAYKLLKNGGDYAKALLDSYQAVMTKEAYLEFMDSMNSVEEIPMAPLEIV
ncbi:MAG TPA: amidohydrolase [Candidatus Lachnoclostridium stercoripullorum]|uniref:Amidohydrolase n=1 Tax=Candidatus Lachnoclostridium stercoripullorum TaxID=2838635 RepID=A0A9D2AVE7_9FIRM|nr:amidohydrolase [Candidatus Lachnoclostridium stercoripullorum]